MDVGVYLATVAGKCFIGVVTLLVAFKIFDSITPDWGFEEAFSGSRFTGGSIIVAAFLLALGLIIAWA